MASQLPNRPIIGKTPYIRSKALTQASRDAVCAGCGADDQTIVPAHPNWSWADKGKSMKAHDLVADLCHTCHFKLDQDKEMSREERELFWLKAFYRTVRNRILNGKLVAA